MNTVAYKLFRVRKDGTLGSLFVDCSARLPLNKWMWYAKHHPTTLAYRPGWHALRNPVAPHLRTLGDDRQWYRVHLKHVTTEERPASQGGTWLLARRMRIVEPVWSVAYEYGYRNMDGDLRWGYAIEHKTGREDAALRRHNLRLLGARRGALIRNIQ